MEQGRPLFIPVILGTTRQGRMSLSAAKLVTGEIATQAGVETDLIDITPKKWWTRAMPMKPRGVIRRWAGSSRRCTRAPDHLASHDHQRIGSVHRRRKPRFLDCFPRIRRGQRELRKGKGEARVVS